jgi:internalin A
MAFVLALPGLCLCSPLRADDAEDKAVAVVKELGGRVTRDRCGPAGPSSGWVCPRGT